VGSGRVKNDATDVLWQFGKRSYGPARGCGCCSPESDSALLWSTRRSPRMDAASGASQVPSWVVNATRYLAGATRWCGGAQRRWLCATRDLVSKSDASRAVKRGSCDLRCFFEVAKHFLAASIDKMQVAPGKEEAASGNKTFGYPLVDECCAKRAMSGC